MRGYVARFSGYRYSVTHECRLHNKKFNSFYSLIRGRGYGSLMRMLCHRYIRVDQLVGLIISVVLVADVNVIDISSMSNTLDGYGF